MQSRQVFQSDGVETDVEWLRSYTGGFRRAPKLLKCESGVRCEICSLGMQTARSKVLRRALHTEPAMSGGPKPRPRPANCVATREDCIGPDQLARSANESPVPASGKERTQTGPVWPRGGGQQ